MGSSGALNLQTHKILQSYVKILKMTAKCTKNIERLKSLWFQAFWRGTRDFLKCSAFDVLRLPFRSARTAPCSDVHRTSELHARALSGSSPSFFIQNKNLPSRRDFCFGEARGTRTPNRQIRSLRLYPLS